MVSTNLETWGEVREHLMMLERECRSFAFTLSDSEMRHDSKVRADLLRDIIEMMRRKKVGEP